MKTTTGRAIDSALSALGLLLLASKAMAGGDLEPVRIPAEEIPWPGGAARVEGTAMRAGLQTLVVAGDAKGNGLYTMMFNLPANTKVPAPLAPGRALVLRPVGHLVLRLWRHARRRAAESATGRQPLHRTRWDESLR